VVNLPWLWLNEAALKVAERLARGRSQTPEDAAAALNDARRELLSWAHRGALEIQGKYWSLPEAAESSIYLDDKDWISLKSSLWESARLAHYKTPASLVPSSPEHRNDKRKWTLDSELPSFETLLFNSQNNPQIRQHDIVIDWGLNTIIFEDSGDPGDFYQPYGYRDLRVRALEIDQIIPPLTHAVGDGDTGKQNRPISVPPSKNPGGAPRKFADDLLIEIIKIANRPDGLPDNKQDLVRMLKEYHAPSWGDNDFPSESTIQQIVSRVYKRIFPQKP
jgi:hypothetical protein